VPPRSKVPADAMERAAALLKGVDMSGWPTL